MYGYRTFLKIGDTQSLDIGSLLKSGYELSSFSYALEQPTDLKGKAQGEVRGGTLQLTIDSIPSNEIIEWMLNPRRYREGVITTLGEDNASIMRIFFKKAACTRMQMKYISKGKGFFSLHIQLEAKNLIFPEGEIENKWLNV
ncbi:type VI secretion system tube protein TssD [Capnocytophaga cynodegmi]|uniref:type VI secretion system tube protein TssD n=1 Tax=Capnocytophaga cynodegmi TaxID=28189 RepID=UPI00385EFFA0